MKRYWYAFMPMITIFLTSAIVIGTATAALSYYKIISEIHSSLLEIVLAVPVAIWLSYGKYDPQVRWDKYSGGETGEKY